MPRADNASRRPAPVELRPMLATLSETLPDSDRWSYEMKWDGIRALALVEPAGVQLRSRNGNDVTVAYPEIQQLAPAIGGVGVLLDGELVAVDDDGRASFQLLQSRMHLRDPKAIERIASRVPVAFMIFDILWFDGRVVIESPYRERRELLDTLALRGDSWQTPPSADDGAEAFAISRQLGFEGVVAKRVDSRYEPGRRSPAWRKVKHQLRQEFVIGGWEFGAGGRAGKVGALLVGYFDDAGALQYAGKVGTGFTEAELERLGAKLAAIEIPAKPFEGRGIPTDARFVKPELIAEVRFTEWTGAGRIRHPAYLGLRDDKSPEEITRE